MQMKYLQSNIWVTKTISIILDKFVSNDIFNLSLTR